MIKNGKNVALLRSQIAYDCDTYYLLILSRMQYLNNVLTIFKGQSGRKK